MKAVMMSIQPKWCELIASGKKTIEVRKTKPKLETPFKCYIYESSGNHRAGNENFNVYLKGKGRKKVIGEFVCDNISETFVVCDVHDELPSRPCEYWLDWESDIDDVPKEACLSAKEIMSYLGKQYNGYAWHISDLVIYDKPKELSEFTVKRTKTVFLNEYNIEGIVCYPKKETVFKELTRPPQSWCYVEELV